MYRMPARKKSLYQNIILEHTNLQKELQDKKTNDNDDELLYKAKILIKYILNSSKKISEVGERKELRFILRFWGNYIYSKTKEVVDIDMDKISLKPENLTYYVNISNTEDTAEHDGTKRSIFDYAKGIGLGLGMYLGYRAAAAGVRMLHVAYYKNSNLKDDKNKVDGEGTDTQT